jgi:hypothetical protein
LGKFMRVLQWKMLVYFTAHWSDFVRPFDIFCDHFVYSMVMWDIFSYFGILYQEKSGNPGFTSSNHFFLKTGPKFFLGE